MDAEYDIVLMDIQMPHVGGLEATRRIRKYTKNQNKPWIIALSAGVMQEEQSAAIDAGMNGFLAKPISVDQLAAALDGIIAL
jgi:CheY-like chemotaxis protein